MKFRVKNINVVSDDILPDEIEFDLVTNRAIWIHPDYPDREYDGGLDEIAAEYGSKWRIDKYADPIEGRREGLSLEEANNVAEEDPNLLQIVDAD